METNKTLTEEQIDKLVRHGGMWVLSSQIFGSRENIGLLWIPHPRITYPGTFESMWPKWRMVIVEKATRKIVRHGPLRSDQKQVFVSLSNGVFYLKHKPNQAFINHMRTQKYYKALCKHDPILFGILSSNQPRDETPLSLYIRGTYRNRKKITKELSENKHAV